MKLRNVAPAEDLFIEDEIEQEIWTAESGLTTAFAVFVVSVRVPTLSSR